MKIYSIQARERIHVTFKLNDYDVKAIFGTEDPSGHYVMVSGTLSGGVLVKNDANNIGVTSKYERRIKLAKHKVVGYFAFTVTARFLQIEEIPFEAVELTPQVKDGIVTYRLIGELESKIKEKVKARCDVSLQEAALVIQEALDNNPNLYLKASGYHKTLRLITK